MRSIRVIRCQECLRGTIRDLAAAQAPEPAPGPRDHEETARKIAECDRKLAQYRAALDTGANLATVVTWIAETEAEKAGYQIATRPAGARQRLDCGCGLWRCARL